MNIKKIIAGFVVILSSTSIFAQTPPTQSPNPTPVRLQLEWYPQGQFGGYFAAKELGYYNAEGLDVEILPGDAETSPPGVLLHKNAEFAISWLPKVIDSPEAYQQLVNIAQIFQRSGTLQAPFKDAENKQLETAMLQDGIYARKDWLANPQNQDVAVRFLRATFKGWIYCRDHERQCIDLSLKQQPEPDKKLTHWQITQVNKLIWPSPMGLGIMNPQAFDQTVAIMQQEKMINFQPDHAIYRSDLATTALTSINAQDVHNPHEQKNWIKNIFSVFKF